MSSTAPVSRKGGGRRGEGGGAADGEHKPTTLQFRQNDTGTVSIDTAAAEVDTPPVMNDVGNRGGTAASDQHKLNPKQLHTTAAVVLNEEGHGRSAAPSAVEMSSAQAAEALCGSGQGVNGAPADAGALDPQVKISNL